MLNPTVLRLNERMHDEGTLGTRMLYHKPQFWNSIMWDIIKSIDNIIISSPLSNLPDRKV